MKKYVSKQLVLDKLLLDCYNSEGHHAIEAGAIFGDPLMDHGKKDARKLSRRKARLFLHTCRYDVHIIYRYYIPGYILRSMCQRNGMSMVCRY